MNLEVQSLPSKRGAYRLHKRLSGHHGAILSLSANKDAAILASGGRDGTRVFCLAEFAQLPRPIGTSNRGATTALTWAAVHDDASAVLIYGTENGGVAVWSKSAGIGTLFEEIAFYQVAKQSEVTSLVFDKKSRRLGLTNRDGLIQVHLLESHGLLEMVFCVETTQFLPKSIFFLPDGEKDVMVAGQECGNLYRLEGATGEAKSILSTGSKIGNAISSSSGIMYDDPFYGPVLLAFDGTRLRKRGFELKEEIGNTKCPRQVVFSDGDTRIVMGTNGGVVVVFERATERIIDELPTGMGAVQTVTTMLSGSKELIFGGNAREVDSRNDVMVWARVQGSDTSQIKGELVERGSSKLASQVFWIVALLGGFFMGYCVLDVLKDHNRSRE